MCSLTRGSIAERSGLRVGHCIIEINGTSTVGLTHKDFVHLLTTTVGDVSPLEHIYYNVYMVCGESLRDLYYLSPVSCSNVCVYSEYNTCQVQLALATCTCTCTYIV